MAEELTAPRSGAGPDGDVQLTREGPVAVLTLDLRALRETSVRVTVDGDVRFEGTMRRGALQVWSGRSITVRATNGDALEIKVNGQPAGTLGPNGQPAEREWRLAT